MLAVAGLVLQGCGGDDDAYMISADDQARIDALVAELADAEDDLEATEAELADTAEDLETAETALAAANQRAMDAQAQVDALTAQIGMMGDAPDADGSLYAQLNAQMEALTMAQAEVASLTGIIGMDPSDADPDGSGLRGQLAMTGAALLDAQMEIGSLTEQIGMAPSADDPNGSGLMGDLAMANADLDAATMKVSMLEEQLGRMPSEGDGGSGLQKELADAKADRDMYMTQAGELAETLGMMGDADNPPTGLYKQLHDAEYARNMYKAMIGSETDAASTADDATMHARLNAKQDEIDAKDMEIAALKEERDKAKQALANLQETRTTEGNIARGLSVVDAIEDATSTNGLPINDKGTAGTGPGVPFDSPAAACTGTTCANHGISVVNGDITLSDFSGGTSTVNGLLNATLTDDTQTVEVYADDLASADLFYFGWWLDSPVDNPPDEPDPASGVISGNRRIAVFVGGTNPVDSLGADRNAIDTDGTDAGVQPYNFNHIRGTATYDGMAVGQYAVETRVGGVRDNMDSGSFTADAQLTANFGDANVATGTDGADGLLSITGTIDDFNLSGSYDPGDLWIIRLDEGAPTAGSDTDIADGAVTANGMYTPFVTDATADNAIIVVTGGSLAPVGSDGNLIAGGTRGIRGDARMTIGGVRGINGAWQAEFYRERLDAQGDEIAPGSIGGSFGIRDDNITVIGSFAADN